AVVLADVRQRGDVSEEVARDPFDALDRTASAQDAFRGLSPADLRVSIRTGRFRGPTAGYGQGCLQGNLAILPAELAGDFLRFCTL
ncbi:hypothetical protein ACSLVP_27460, partial [Klebsiella pneumoniae]|uniref:hypothetical protein n=1 Tax=Klebsiella pneumoniae TaxID=573 RepID=UPI003EE16F19